MPQAGVSCSHKVDCGNVLRLPAQEEDPADPVSRSCVSSSWMGSLRSKENRWLENKVNRSEGSCPVWVFNISTPSRFLRLGWKTLGLLPWEDVF